MNYLISRVVALLIAFRWPLFAVAAITGVLAWGPASRVHFDRSIERMFAADDPLLPPYERLKANFGGNEIVMAVYSDERLLDPDGSGLARLAAIAARLEAVEGVRDVLSLHEVNGVLEKLEEGKRLGSILNIFSRRKREPRWKGPAILNPNSKLAERYRDLFAGYTHSPDGKTAAVVCMLEPVPHIPGSASDPRTETVEKMQAIIADLPDGLSPGVLAGEPVMVVEGFELLEEDGRRLGTWSTILLGLTILVCFRSVRWLVASVLIVQWTLLMTKASLELSGTELSMVSSMLTAIITVVGVAAVVHLIVHYRELRIAGTAPRQAFQYAAVVLAIPVVGAVATDVAGFGSLWGASVGPVEDFGTMTALGALLVFPALCLILPTVALAGARDTGPAKQGWGEGQIGSWLSHSVAAIRARPVAVGIASLIVTGLAIAGTFWLEVETDFTRNFRSGSRIVKSYDFVETRLGGAGVWDVVIPAPPRLNRDYMARVRKLEDRLRAITVASLQFPHKPEAPAKQTADQHKPEAPAKQPAPQPAVQHKPEAPAKQTALQHKPEAPAKQSASQSALTKVISLVDALDAAEDDPEKFAVLSSPEVKAVVLKGELPAFMAALRTETVDANGQARLRIMLRARERQPAEQKRRLIQEVSRIVHEEFPQTAESAGGEVTGFFVLLTSLIESMIRDQWITFSMATGTIFVMVLLAFRSLKYALISLVPNALPILGVMGLMGWLGLKINMGAAMIAAVSMGLSVDSSIHYLASFRSERRAGRSVAAALSEVQKSVGRAMLVSTLALVVGFGVLMTSDFVPTIYFGALVSLAMVGGLAGNLIVLPLILSWVERDRPQPLAEQAPPEEPAARPAATSAGG